MMKDVKQKLTLDRPAIYQIKVPGYISENWSDWVEGMTITVESGDDGPPTTNVNYAVPVWPYLGFRCVKPPQSPL